MSRVVLDLGDLEAAIRVFDGAARDLDALAARLRSYLRSTSLDRRHTLVRRLAPTEESQRVSSWAQDIANQVETDRRELRRIADFVEEELGSTWNGPSFLGRLEALGGALLASAGELWNWLRGLSGAAVSGLGALGAGAIAGAQRLFGLAIDTLYQRAEAALGGVRDVAEDASQAYRSLSATITGFLAAMAGHLALGFDNFWDRAQSIVGRVIDAAHGEDGAFRVLSAAVSRLLALLGDLGLGLGVPLRTEAEYLADLAGASDPLAYWYSLTDAEREYLAVSQRVGNLEGVPYEVRYRANNLAIAAEGERLRSALRWALPDMLIGGRQWEAGVWLRCLEVLDEYSTACGAEGGACLHQVLYFDPAHFPDHGIVEVHGNLDAALDVVVAIPGQGTNVANFEDFSNTVGGLSGNDPTRATIAWLDYDAPTDVFDEPNWEEERASIDGSSLGAVIGGLPSWQSVTLLGHSAGTSAAQYFVVSQQYSDAVDRIDRIVLLAPPGISRDFQEIASNTPVFIGRYQNDVIGLTRYAQGLTGIEDSQDVGALTDVPGGWQISLGNTAPEGFGPVSFAAHGLSGYLSGDMLDDLNLFRQDGMERTVRQITNADGSVEIVVTYLPRF